VKIDARLLVRLYPRKWRERYGEELLALVDDQPVTVRDTADLVANCLREWERTLQLGRVLGPMAAGAAANAVGWFLRDTLGRLPFVDAAFPGVMGTWIAIWVLICARLAPAYWRWLSAPLHRQPPPLPTLSLTEARCVLALAAIVGVVVPWNMNIPREWWSFASNPSFSMLMVTSSIIWPPLRPSSFESTTTFSSRPPKSPLGLT
jgi:hypothetical protein